MNVVTGAFGYTGKYIARLLVKSGERVVTLTESSAQRSEFGPTVKAFPFRFEEPAAMAASLAGAHTLYNTYWVRFDRGDEAHDRAVRNLRVPISEGFRLMPPSWFLRFGTGQAGLG
jgi:uncharacterized protein YbjT (DUF2867 family)